MNEAGMHQELTQRIIGAAMEVHCELRNGLDEKLYENACGNGHQFQSTTALLCDV